ncbi:MAG TPA: PaaI family thioesterase [Acetobacteraceae bacterium]|nr:PaaI family thioesterase [Acetobacteraceae bacterium]
MSTPPLTVAELQERLGHSQFIEFLGLTVIEANPELQRVTMTLSMRREFERGKDSGQWHGGPIAAVIDTVGDYALVMMLGRPLPTVNFRVDYVRPAINTALTATARVRRAGKTIGVVDVDVIDDSGNLVAVGRASYATG